LKQTQHNTTQVKQQQPSLLFSSLILTKTRRRFDNAGEMAEKAKPQQQQRFAFSLPVTVVVSSILYIYISTIFVFIDRWFGLFSSPGIANAVVFTAIASMCVFSYRTAISTDPGRVPSTYTPDIEDNQTPIHEIKRKVTPTLQNSHKKLIEFVSRYIN
jgi:hypothetical protein